jgi:hypothetical protein
LGYEFLYFLRCDSVFPENLVDGMAANPEFGSGMYLISSCPAEIPEN